MIQVTQAMVNAALARLNKLRGDAEEGETVAMQWGDVVREVYIAMECVRRAELVSGKRSEVVGGEINGASMAEVHHALDLIRSQASS